MSNKIRKFDVEWINHLLAASGEFSDLYSTEEVNASREYLIKAFKNKIEITPETDWRQFLISINKDEEKLQIAQALIYFREEAKVENDVLEAIDKCDNRCHFCGSDIDLKQYNFGLARMIESKRTWEMMLSSIAISAISIPLFGRGIIHGPGKEKTANLLRLHLNLCRDCQQNHKGAFGKAKLSQEDYHKHPWWEKAQEFGYTTFIDAKELMNWGTG